MHQTLRWQSKLERKCERESESSSCQLISVSERNTLCDRCCPAVTQPEPYTILPFDWRLEPANTSSTGGGATAAITPSQRGQPSTLMHYMTCLHTTGTSIHDLHGKQISISYFSVWKQQHDTGSYFCWFNILSINISKQASLLVKLWTNP